MAKGIAIYSRKSRFTGKGESIENQIELCRQYIEKHYMDEAPLEILTYEDEGFSGKNTSRPELRKMFQDARKGKFSVLVCYRLDRISRNVGDFAYMIEDLNKQGIDFISIREAFDTTNPMGRAMMYIASVFAQLERETIAERIRDNMYELSKTGRWLGGTTPTGYTSEGTEKAVAGGRSRKAFKLKVIPEEARIVKIIFDKFLETGSLTKTDAFLVQNGYTTKNNISFTRFSIKSILENPVYMIADEDAYRYITENEMELFSDKEEFDGKHGIMAYNRTLQRDGAAHRERDRKEWIVSVGRHEGIIGGYQWVKVQELLKINKSKAYRKPRSNAALLSGLLLCGGCGNYMRPKLTKRCTDKGERSYYYLCSMKEKSNRGCCGMKNPNGNMLDRAVCEAIKKIPRDASAFLKQMEQLYKALSDNKKEQGFEIDRLKKLLGENEREINSLVNSLARLSGSAAEQYIIKQIEECHAKGEQLKSRIAEAEASAADSELSDMKFAALRQEMTDFASCFDKAAIEQKRAAVRSFVQKAVWDGRNLHLYLFKDNAVNAEPSGEDSK